MEAEEPERQLKCVEVEVKCKLSGSDSPPSIYKVRVRPSDNLRKIKRHIIESLDIQGKLMYGDHNVDDHPYRRLEDGVLRGNKFYLTIDRKHRDLKQHSVKLHLHEVSGENVRPVEVKIARTTTIVNLKRKIQNEFGIPVEEQSIHVQYQQKGCQLETNVMQLPQPLEVKWQKKECGSPVKSTRKVQQQKISHGTPYDVKLSSKRKGYECSSIHPKKLAKSKGIHSVFVCQCKFNCNYLVYDFSFISQKLKIKKHKEAYEYHCSMLLMRRYTSLEKA